MKKSAAAFNASGTSLDKSLALIVATNDVLQNPETTGTLWNTLSARVRGASLELETLGEETDEYVTSTSKLRDLVKGTTGFDILKEDGQTFKDLYDIMLGIGEVWDDLTDTTKAGLAEALAGKRNARGLYSIFSNMEDLQDAYATAESAAGSAKREQENYAQSVQYSIDRAKASLEQLANDFLSSDLLKGLIEAGNSALKVIDNIVAKLGSVQSIILALSGMSLIKNLIGAESIVGNLIGSITESVTDKEASKSLIPNLKKLFGGIAAKRAAKEAGKSLSESLAEGTAGTLADPMTDGLSGATESASEVGSKTATKFLAGFASSFSPIVLGGIVAAGLGAAAAFAIYKYKQYEVEKARKQTLNDIKALEATQAQVSKFQDEYSSLYDRMTDPNNTDEETLQYKQQIYDLQQQIVAQYGAQAAGIDLVNGKLETQLALIDNIAEQQSGAELLANESTYDTAYEKMHKVNAYQIDYGSGNIEAKGPLRDIKQITDTLSDYGFSMTQDNDYGMYTISLDADATKADEALDEFSKRLLELRNRFKDNSDYTEIIDQISSGITSAKSKVKKTTDEWQEIYESGMTRNANINSDNLLTRYRDGIEAYNKALSMGEKESIEQTKSALESLEKEREDFISKKGNDIYAELFDAYKVDEHQEKLYNFKNYLSQTVSERKKYGEKIGEENAESIISGTEKQLTDEPLDLGKMFADANISDTVDFKRAVDNVIKQMSDAASGATAFAGLKDSPFNSFVSDIINQFGLMTADPSVYQSIIDSIGAALTEEGLLVTPVTEANDRFSVSLEEVRASANSAMSAIDSLNAALASSASGKGMSYEWDAENGAYTGDVPNIQKMFEGMEGYNPATLFRRTANGIKVNTNELRKLQKAQEDITKDKFYEKQVELSERLAEAEKLRAINDPSAPSDEVINRLRDQLEEVNLLASAYDGATSAYQQWLNAQSAGEEGDVYDNIRDTALKRGDELLEKGLIGTEEFRAVTELMTGLDLTSASAVEVAEAYKTIDNEIGDTGHTMRDFFKEGFDGASEYLDVLEKLGYAWTDEQGNTWFNDINTAELAKQLGTSVDVVESLFGKLHDYGAEFHIFTPEQAAELNAQKESIEEVKTAIDEANKDAEHPIQVRTDVENMNDLDTLNGEIDHIQGILKHPTEVGINDAQYQAFAQLLDELIKRKEILQGFDTSEGVTTNAIDAGATALQTLNESMEKYSELGLEINLDDKTLLDAAEVIESLPEELKIKFGFEGDATAEEILEQLAGEHSVTIAVKPDGMPTSAWEAKQKAEQESASAGDEFKEAISTVADDVSTKVNEAGETFAQTVTEAATTFKEILNGGTDAEKRQNEYERKTQEGYKEAEATKKRQEEIRKQREAEAAAEAERLKALRQQEYENLTESKRNEPTAQRRENRDAIAENQNRWIRQTVAGQRELDTVARNKEIEQARQQELEDLQRYNRDYENIKRNEMDVLKQETDRKQEEEANKPSIIDKIPGNKLSDEEIERRLSQEPTVYDSSFGPSPEEFKDYDVSLGGIADAAAAAGAALTGVTVEASELDSGIQNVQETASQPIDVDVNVDSTEVESAVSSAQESAPPVEVSAELSTEQIDAEIASWVETEKPVIQPLVQMPDTPVSGALTTIKQSIQTTVDTSNVDAATTNIANKDVAISVDTTDAQASIDTLKQSIEEVTTPQEGSASVKVEGTSDLESLNSAEQTFHAFGDHTNRNAAITEGLQALQNMNSANTTFRGFQDKTVTNTTRNVTENIVKSGGTIKLNGTANVNGTALSNFYGSAYAGGKWGTNKDETALMAELGPEIMV